MKLKLIATIMVAALSGFITTACAPPQSGAGQNRRNP